MLAVSPLPSQLRRHSNRTYPGMDGIDPAQNFLPLVLQQRKLEQPFQLRQLDSGLSQSNVNTTVLEQPLDLSTLAPKFNKAVVDFVEQHQSSPFFLYVPFAHVHATRPNQPQEQYASCAFQNSSERGLFGDALAEVDWVIGNLVDKLDELHLMEHTLILFTGDKYGHSSANSVLRLDLQVSGVVIVACSGPDMFKQQSGGSEGLFTGRFAGYWNTGKGSTWEG